MILKLKMRITGKICEVSNLLKTYSQNLWYILKLVTPAYTLDCNVSYISKDKD